MSATTLLKIVFAGILVSMILCTGWASLHQSLPQYSGLTTGSDRYWNIATLFDAYFGFLTFYLWVFYKRAPLAAANGVVHRHHGARQHGDGVLRHAWAARAAARRSAGRKHSHRAQRLSHERLAATSCPRSNT